MARRLADCVGSAVQVRADLLDDILVCLVAEGHILIEDLPGVGKTTLARALARAMDLQFARVQCTADLLPADVVGTNVFNQRENRFEFRPGPVFANVVLVDEINRASPKTQSGLLECMQERHVTVDVHTHELAKPFLVIATQNPVEYEGTYPLPEAQLDRFTVRVALGYPDAEDEADMLAEHAESDRVLDLGPVADVAEVLAAQAAAGRVHASEALRRYVVGGLDARGLGGLPAPGRRRRAGHRAGARGGERAVSGADRHAPPVRRARGRAGGAAARAAGVAAGRARPPHPDRRALQPPRQARPRAGPPGDTRSPRPGRAHQPIGAGRAARAAAC